MEVFVLKNSLIRRMYIILFITVFAVAGGVFAIVCVLSFKSLVSDIRYRTEGVREYIVDAISVSDVTAVGDSPDRASSVRKSLMVTLERLNKIVNLKQLYIANFDEAGYLFTSLDRDEGDVLPSGRLLADLRRSADDVALVTGSSIYHTGHGSVYTAFWPVLDAGGSVLGVVCMEFDVEEIYQSYRLMLFYSIGISLALVVLFSIVAYLYMSRSTENIYKTIAYLDLLTGYENRMAYEQRLSACDGLAGQGESIAVMIFDLNNLKAVNDAYGHKFGDTLIKNSADILASHLGDPKRLYRIGGDEFAAVLVGLSWPELQKIQLNIRSDNRTVMEDMPFSCAVGMARFDKTGDRSVREAMQRADEAMYEDKRRSKGFMQKELDIDKVPKGNVALLREHAKSASIGTLVRSS